MYKIDVDGMGGMRWVCPSERFLDPPAPTPPINFVHDQISIY